MPLDTAQPYEVQALPEMDPDAPMELAPEGWEELSAKDLKRLRLESELNRIAREPTTFERWRSGAGHFYQALAEIPAGTSESIAVIAKKLEHTFTGKSRPIEEYDTYKYAQGIRRTMQKAAPTDPRVIGFWEQTLPQAAGIMAAFAAGGIASKSKYLLADKSKYLFPAAAGAAVGGAGAYEEARAAGASEDDAFDAWLFNAGVGLTEVAGVSRILDRLDKSTGGGLKGALITAGKSSIEEAIQEVFQSAAGNVIAQKIYDQAREVDEGVQEAGAAGGVTGFAMGLLASLVIGKKGGRRVAGIEPSAEQQEPWYPAPSVDGPDQVPLVHPAAEGIPAGTGPGPGGPIVGRALELQSPDTGDPLEIPPTTPLRAQGEVPPFDPAAPYDLVPASPEATAPQQPQDYPSPVRARLQLAEAVREAEADIAPGDPAATEQALVGRPVVWSMEGQPGWNTGYLRGMFDADYNTKAAFEADINAAFVNPETGRDEIAEALGIDMGIPGQEDYVGPSLYRNSAGQIEINPARQLVGRIAGEDPGSTTSEVAMRKIKAYAALRGAFSYQEMVAGYRLFHTVDPEQWSVSRIEAGRPLTKEEVETLNRLVSQRFSEESKGWIVAPYPVQDGLLLINIRPEGESDQQFKEKNLEFQRDLPDILDRLLDAHQALSFTRHAYGTETHYESNDWQKHRSAEAYLGRASELVGPDIPARLAVRLHVRMRSVYQKWSKAGYGTAPGDPGGPSGGPPQDQGLGDRPSDSPKANRPPPSSSRSLSQSLIERLEGFKIPTDGNVYDGMLGLPIYVWNGALGAIQTAISAGQTLAQAIETAVAWIRKSYTGTWDEAGFREVFKAANGKQLAGRLEALKVPGEPGDLAPRKFSVRLAADEGIAPDVRAATGNDTYQPVPNALTAAEAIAIVDSRGLAGALAILKDERNGLPERTRVTLGEAIIRKANRQFELGDTAGLDLAVDAAEWLTEYGTRLGQGVQAFAIWSRLTPAGFVRAYKRAIDQALAEAGIDPGQVAINEAPGATRRGRQRRRKKLAYDPKFAKELLARGEAAMKLPAGFQRDEAILEILGDIARVRGLSTVDILTALWYGNILSGWTTQARNFLGTLSNLLMESWAHGIARPSAIPQILVGMYQGLIRGMNDAVKVLRTGKVTGTRIKKLELPRVLELVKFKGVAYPLNAWKYVFRLMAGSDMMFFRSAEEMHARYLARGIAMREGLEGDALNKRLAELLLNTPAHRAAAQAQAQSEGLKPGSTTYRRRVFEVMEQSRPDTLVDRAADYGRFATFNQEPDGVLGVFARGIANMSRQVPALRLLVPFTHVVANVGNAALNWTPHGYLRLFNYGNIKGERAADWGTDEYKLQAARATLGTVGLAALYALAKVYEDDEDPEFAITAEGPAETYKRQQLQATGWRPYSVKVGGAWVPYQYTTMHMGLAFMGALLDAVKYKKLDEADAMNRAYYALSRIPATILSQSFLRGLSDFFGSMSRSNVQRTGNAFGGLARVASGVLVPNLVKQVDRLFDPTIYQADTVQAALVRDLPVARQGLRPMLNVLGDPVEVDMNPFLSLRRKDDVFDMLARKGAWVTVPDKQTMLGDRPMRPGEYYDYVRRSGRRIRAVLEAKGPILESVDKETAQDLVAKWVRQERAKTKKELFGQ